MIGEGEGEESENQSESRNKRAEGRACRSGGDSDRHAPLVSWAMGAQVETVGFWILGHLDLAEPVGVRQQRGPIRSPSPARQSRHTPGTRASRRKKNEDTSPTRATRATRQAQGIRGRLGRSTLDCGATKEKCTASLNRPPSNTDRAKSSHTPAWRRRAGRTSCGAHITHTFTAMSIS